MDRLKYLKALHIGGNLLFLTVLLLCSACTPANIHSTSLATPLALLSTPTTVITPSSTQKPAVISSQQPTLSQPEITLTSTSSSQGGNLSPAQEARLYQSALSYLASSEPQAIKVAQSIGYLGVNGFPSTMCGPLAMAILRGAGLVDADTNLTQFFYLNPRPGKSDAVIASTFPDQLYQKIEINLPSNKIDFVHNPLIPGDFVYLFAGPGGNFDHIITVDRVDSAGRAYAVTNLNTPNGYIIKEVMLYDPAVPGTGQIYAWTDRNNASLGLTGIWIWRLRQQPLDPDARTLQFSQAIEEQKKSAGGTWNIEIKEAGKDPLYSSLAYQIIHPASTIKIADAVLFFKALEMKNVQDVPAYIQKFGTDSRSFDQLLHAMLVNSEEDATTALENWTGQILDVNQTIHDLGFPNTFITPRQSTADEMARMLESLYEGKLVSPAEREIIFNYLGEITPNDSTLLGVMRQNFSSDDTLYDKRGEIASQRIIVADLALLRKGDKTYILAIYAYHDPKASNGSYEELQYAIEKISLLFWNYTEGN
jgi:hypothetical protein